MLLDSIHISAIEWVKDFLKIRNAHPLEMMLESYFIDLAKNHKRIWLQKLRINKNIISREVGVFKKLTHPKVQASLYINSSKALCMAKTPTHHILQAH